MIKRSSTNIPGIKTKMAPQTTSVMPTAKRKFLAKGLHPFENLETIKMTNLDFIASELGPLTSEFIKRKDLIESAKFLFLKNLKKVFDKNSSFVK